MTEAYVLAGELRRAGNNHRVAFANHEEHLRTFIAGKQTSARKFAASFVPNSALGIWFRNQVTRLMRAPMIADSVIRRSVNLMDDFDLPDYGFPVSPPETADHDASPAPRAAARG